MLYSLPLPDLTSALHWHIYNIQEGQKKKAVWDTHSGLLSRALWEAPASGLESPREL